MNNLRLQDMEVMSDTRAQTDQHTTTVLRLAIHFNELGANHVELKVMPKEDVVLVRRLTSS